MLWHEHVRRTAKLMAVGALHYTGLLGLMRKARMKDRALILMYHRVSPRGQGVSDYSPNGITVTPREFAMHLRFLIRHYQVVPLSRVVQAVRNEAPFVPNMCAITFDDGWYDVYQHAFPLLREYAIPATIFLTTGFIDGDNWFWEERSKYLLALLHQYGGGGHGPDKALDHAHSQLSLHGFGGLMTLPSSRLPSYLLEKGRELKRRDPEQRRAFMRMLEGLAASVAPHAVRPFVTWSEAQEMCAHGIEFENHTVSHPILSELPLEKALTELCSAAEQIQTHLGRSPKNVAYPYGKYDERVRSELARQHIYSACTTHMVSWSKARIHSP